MLCCEALDIPGDSQQERGTSLLEVPCNLIEVLHKPLVSGNRREKEKR